MSGHSKWANIKHRKGAQDAKRGKIFTKIIKEIAVAAKIGGGDVDTNPRLRLAVQNAKGQNMPKDNIERAIKKAIGADAEDYLETTYEGYGPNGVAVFVECTTDNLNRTVSNVRSIFSKYGGSLGVNGSVEYMFDRKGIFSIKTEVGNFDEDDLTLELIDGGAEEVEFVEGYMAVTCAMEDFGNMQKKIESLNLNPENAELQRIPSTTVALDNDAFAKAMKLIDALEDDDDIQKVYHNIEATDAQLESL
ncbi:MAG: YebC/PmpR family DNA-binding transcriptional regulator [Cyclobacteriaceae bacterium]|nr:YebC/PmpR family DNA-binding transcriptional regulator [Cyclobacteriaceae bacterium]